MADLCKDYTDSQRFLNHFSFDSLKFPAFFSPHRLQRLPKQSDVSLPVPSPLPSLWCPLALPLFPDSKLEVDTLHSLSIMGPFLTLAIPTQASIEGQKRSRKGSKLERSTPEGIILVLWRVEGQLFASCIVTSRTRECESRETNYSD